MTAQRSTASLPLTVWPSASRWIRYTPDPTSSPDDRLVTQQLVAAGQLLDIPVHDHVIVGRGRYTSFAEAGLL